LPGLSGLSGFQRLAVVTTVLTLALVALGGAVRATDSGLACPDWPRCFGAWIPPADVHMWLEHSHRLLAGVVGLLIATLTIWALARHRQRASVVWPAVAALVLVVAQAGLGAVVVLLLLRAELVTAHLGMAMVVVACLVYLTVNVSLPRDPRPGRDLRFARLSAAVAALSFAQILVGGHVTGIGAGLVFTDFPLMDGALVPALDGEREVFHLTHRLLAYLLAAAVVYLCAQAVGYRRRLTASGAWRASDRWLVKLPMWGATLVVVQIVLGVANLWTRTSPWTVIPHLAVASWIWTVLALLTVLAYRWAPAVEARRAAPVAAERTDA
jgi:heme a synthase